MFRKPPIYVGDLRRLACPTPSSPKMHIAPSPTTKLFTLNKPPSMHCTWPPPNTTLHQLTLLEGLENLLQIKLLGQTLHGSQALLSVALLHTDVHVVLVVLALAVSKASVRERVCNGAGTGVDDCPTRRPASRMTPPTRYLISQPPVSTTTLNASYRSRRDSKQGERKRRTYSVKAAETARRGVFAGVRGGVCKERQRLQS